MDERTYSKRELRRIVDRALTRGRRRRLATITEQIRRVIDESRPTADGEQ